MFLVWGRVRVKIRIIGLGLGLRLTFVFIIGAIVAGANDVHSIIKIYKSKSVI